MRTRSIAAIFVAVLLVGSLASCSKKDSGSSDESTGDKTEQTDKSTTTKDESTNQSDSTDESVSDAGSDDISNYLGDCGQVYVLYSTMIASSAAMMGGVTDEQVQELQHQADQVRDSVPSDLQDDIQTVADAYEEFATAISDGGFMSDDAQAASEHLDSDEVKAAQQNIEDYFSSCQN